MRSLCYENQFSFIFEIRTNYHNKNFALRLTLKERLRGTRKWPIWPSSSPAKSNSRGILSAAFLLLCTESYNHEVGFSFPCVLRKGLCEVKIRILCARVQSLSLMLR